ncbi:hypothetical protein PoB_002490500 [Plakobranchus ocellatus]|uniref:Uncharacterized protein n=1 Tax=Plakobranchus ocellatus TaxID=259542 RepID=A0AAV3ZTF0_9GAST|nr:hypothetical protein PoB_002490500 [Plakobranchus ocellatus]
MIIKYDSGFFRNDREMNLNFYVDVEEKYSRGISTIQWGYKQLGYHEASRYVGKSCSRGISTIQWGYKQMGYHEANRYVGKSCSRGIYTVEIWTTGIS